MTIEDVSVIDGFGLDDGKDPRTLLLSDHLPWDQDIEYHLGALRRKLNGYVNFIHSGQVKENFPEYTGRPDEISMYCKYETNDVGMAYLNYAKDKLEKIGIRLYHETLHSLDD